MTVTPEPATAELAEQWVKALSNIDLFLEICVDDCPVWHSADDRYVPVAQAVSDVYARSGDGVVPTFEPHGITFTEKGFYNECSTEVMLNGQLMKLHLIQLVEVKDGKAVRVKEYIGPEMGVQP